MNTYTVVYYDLIPMCLSTAEHTYEHEMHISPLLNIVPNKCTIYKVKNYIAQLFNDITSDVN